MAAKRYLRAGPVRLVFGDGDLRDIRLGDRVIVERIYAAVRDRNWATVPARLEDVRVSGTAGGFTVSFTSVHRQEGIEFRWKGSVIGDATGKVVFTFDGAAHTSFLRNRIGFCVHHPLRECAGRACEIEKADGAVEKGAFPDFIAPHQPFLDIRAIRHEVRPGVMAEVRFAGEVFEMEDHRNWTDANFKTYGTPLRLPFPVEIKSGDEVHQRIELTLKGELPKVSYGAAGTVELRTGAGAAVPLPAIGLGLPLRGRAMSAEERERVKALRLAHVRVDVDSAETLAAAMRAGAELGLPLEVATARAGELSAPEEGVVRWLVYDPQAKVSTPEALARARQALGAGAALAGGTNAYFTELNRNRFAPSGLAGVCFSVNPQVHAFDDESVMANTLAQRDVVRSTRSFMGAAAVVVSPVTLRPRFNPDATGEAPPLPPDPRQKLDFCAAWTVASLRYLAEGGAASATYFETHGAGGVQDGAAAFPVYQVFAAIAPFGGGRAEPWESSHPGRALALVLELGGRRRALVANLTGEPLRARLRGETIALAGYAVAARDWKE